ncbi:MAG: phosphatase [Actinomycetota bacterium]|nr:phosphatase [Actinomycetota bacterium]
MTYTRSRVLIALAIAAAGISALTVAGSAAPPEGPYLSDVATPNVKAVGFAPASKLSTELRQIAQAQGSTQLENPNAAALTSFYGYQNDVVSADDATKPQMVPTLGVPNEAQKTEPDKNTYLVFDQSLPGADPNYYYGTHFLYQGHELATTINGKKQGYITRINLDADAKHRVTLLATQDSSGQPIATIDGSTWDPWAKRLLFTTENANAPTYAATPGFPSVVEDVSGSLGRGGYEGIQNDSAGNLIIVEDISGANKAGSTKSKMPNSFVYRYVPATPGDLHNGKLQVLQVLNASDQPITFTSESTFPSADQTALHTYGNVFTTHWVTIHDTAVDGNTPFNANVWAKGLQAAPAQPAEKQGTPFKRPENGQFRPGSDFTQFFFDETGDTDATSSENGNPDTGVGGTGGWGGIFKLHQSPTSDAGKLSLFYKGNIHVTGLDNASFLSKNKITFVEDAGDTLHSQRNALDSGYVFDVKTDYSNVNNQPLRWLALGRDPSATIDSSYGFSENDGDNEITGTTVSNGDPTAEGILGAEIPHLFKGGWRWFYTQQHGDNPTYEVVPSSSKQANSDD